MKTNFDEAKYWIKRGAKYKEEFEKHDVHERSVFRKQEEEFEELCRKFRTTKFRKIKTVLEIGCGFGRLTKILLKHLPNLERYVCMDISKEQVLETQKLVNKEIAKKRKVSFVVGNFVDYEFDEFFDFVFASEVFLHFPPNQIEGVLAKAIGLSRKVFAHIDPSPYSDQRFVLWRNLRGRNSWPHNYICLYRDCSVKSISLFPLLDRTQYLWMVDVK